MERAHEQKALKDCASSVMSSMFPFCLILLSFVGPTAEPRQTFCHISDKDCLLQIFELFRAFLGGCIQPIHRPDTHGKVMGHRVHL